MRSVQTRDSAHVRTDGASLAGVAAKGTIASWSFRRLDIPHSPSCVTFAPRELPRFIATTYALTPADPALRFPVEHEHRSPQSAGLPESCIAPSDHSNSNHPPSPLEHRSGFGPGSTARYRPLTIRTPQGCSVI